MSMRDRIAQALINAYHGSPERGLKVLRTRQGIETPNTTFHASNPDVAETFTVPREYGEPVFYDHRGREIKPGHVYETQLTPRSLLEMPPRDAQRFIDDTAYQTGVMREAKQGGHDTVVARDVLEGIGELYRGDIYAVTDDDVQNILRRYGMMGAVPMSAEAFVPQEAPQ